MPDWQPRHAHRLQIAVGILGPCKTPGERTATNRNQYRAFQDNRPPLTFSLACAVNHGRVEKVQSYCLPLAVIETAYFAPLASGARGTTTTVA